ncbi:MULTISPECIES: tautomerase family protein [Nostoc]|jgi:4-oxalocrotonate tautomerase family enzyme|uniref:Tautomerase family protein n=1 Tax=Nostoc punctiforme FACHB-252 TaxID=1357509 RepID=A0ABR8HH52_NOSPU|nr:tautomerase family protein [Nostoc punctiforme]MBC1241144.1 tautomerase family protein [Nostoc sp. 2RC]MBD2614500.1 tautomerase family protein [Nostoc punctiforme FACHB-252]MBL1202762.1 tautomerase family protein [Nostoc sp. GBBB01]
MAQIKVYGLADKLNSIKAELSNIIHTSMIDILQLPPDKKFHRFFPLDKSDFYYPPDRSVNYLIIEISMFEGRTVETKKQLITHLIQNIHEKLNISLTDIEITIFETPKHNWGIRGLPGDELVLNYKVEV